MSNDPIYRIFCLLVGCLSAFSFGWHSGVINPPREAMSNCDLSTSGCIPMDNSQWGFFVSLFLVGGVIGGLYGGVLANKFGPKSCLQYNNIPFLIGTILLYNGNNVSSFYLARLVIGFGAGCCTAQLPMYISDISPPELRQSYGALNQFFIVLGILISNICGAILSTPTSWRYLFLLSAVPSILQMILLSFCAESPIWLEKAGYSLDSEKVRDELKIPHMSIRINSNNNSTSDLERSEVENDAFLNKNFKDAKYMSLNEIFANPSTKSALFVGLMLHVAQQFSGINAAIYYSSTIFSKNFDAKMANYFTVLVSISQLVFTFLTTISIEKLGRKTLLLTSQIGMCFFAFMIAISGTFNFKVALVISLMGYVSAFSLGLGPIPWMLFTELLPDEAKGSSQSVGTAVNWGGAFIIALTFPLVDSLLGLSTFYIFGLALFFFIIFTVKYLPESTRYNQ